MDEDEKRRFILILSAIVAALAVHRCNPLPQLSQTHAFDIKLPRAMLSVFRNVY